MKKINSIKFKLYRKQESHRSPEKHYLQLTSLSDAMVTYMPKKLVFYAYLCSIYSFIKDTLCQVWLELPQCFLNVENVFSICHYYVLFAWTILKWIELGFGGKKQKSSIYFHSLACIQLLWAIFGNKQRWLKKKIFKCQQSIYVICCVLLLEKDIVFHLNTF